MTSIGRVVPPAVVLKIYCKSSCRIDRVKCIQVGPILLAGYLLMEGRPLRVLSETRCSYKVNVVVNVKGLNLIFTYIYGFGILLR